MHTIVIATCAASALAASLATADDLPVRSTADVEVVFKALDRNKDQQISRSEASVKGSVSKRFDGIDSCSDRQFVPSWEKMLGTLSGCEDGGLSSAIPCGEPEVIAM